MKASRLGFLTCFSQHNVQDTYPMHDNVHATLSVVFHIYTDEGFVCRVYISIQAGL